MDIIIGLMGIKVVWLNLMATVIGSFLAALPIVVGLILFLPMPTKRIERNH